MVIRKDHTTRQYTRTNERISSSARTSSLSCANADVD